MKKTQKRTNKTARALVALALSAILLAGGCAVGYGAGTRWTYKRSDIQATEPAAPDDGNGGTIITPGDDNGGAVITPDDGNNDIQIKTRKLERSEYAANGISEHAESSFGIVASVSPALATNPKIDWSIAWLDPESEWASGKNVNDYYAISPIADGALSAYAVCYQAYAEPVIITLTSRDNINVKATVRADYVPKLLNVNFSAPCLRFISADEEPGYYLKWSDGTLPNGNFEIIEIRYNLTADFIKTFDAVVSTYAEYFDTIEPFACSNNMRNVSPEIFQNLDETSDANWTDGYESFVNFTKEPSTQMQMTIRNELISAANKRYRTNPESKGDIRIEDVVEWTIDYTYTVDGETIQKCAEFPHDLIIPYISVTSITTNSDNIKH